MLKRKLNHNYRRQDAKGRTTLNCSGDIWTRTSGLNVSPSLTALTRLRLIQNHHSCCRFPQAPKEGMDASVVARRSIEEGLLYLPDSRRWPHRCSQWTQEASVHLKYVNNPESIVEEQDSSPGVPSKPTRFQGFWESKLPLTVSDRRSFNTPKFIPWKSCWPLKSCSSADQQGHLPDNVICRS